MSEELIEAAARAWGVERVTAADDLVALADAGYVVISKEEREAADALAESMEPILGRMGKSSHDAVRTFSAEGWGRYERATSALNAYRRAREQS